MKPQNRTLLSIIKIRQWAALFLVVQATVIAGTVNWQGPAGLTIKSVHYLKTESGPIEPAAQLSAASLQEVTFPYPVPPLAGFSPLIVITTSDKHVSGDDTFSL